MLGFIDWIQKPDYGVADMVGAVRGGDRHRRSWSGLAVGWLAVQGLQRTRLASAGLYPVASLAIAALAFGAADVLHGSGFLAVYLAGLALGSAQIPAKRTIITFHTGMGWLAQVVMFLVLGLLVFPSQLGEVWLEGTVLAFVVVLVARPHRRVRRDASGCGFAFAERIVLGWAGLRGAVPVVLATFPVIEGVDGQPRVLQHRRSSPCSSRRVLQGTTFEALAARLGVTTSESALPAIAAGRRRRPAARRRGGRVPGRRPGTRSPATACGRPACRATPCST